MNNVKKFWIINLFYIVVFWTLPFIPTWNDIFFGFGDSCLRKIGIRISFFMFYYFVIIPVVIYLSYLLIKNLKIRFKNTLFILFYILLPYIITIFLFFYFLIKIVSNPDFLTF